MEKPELSSIPLTPGVYLFKDGDGRVLYVGKAKCLRKRLSSYFRAESLLPSKTRHMLARAENLETISTSTENEALLLESSLIKKHRPHYNILLRDDKEYALFRLDLGVDFPRLEIVRQTRGTRAGGKSGSVAQGSGADASGARSGKGRAAGSDRSDRPDRAGRPDRHGRPGKDKARLFGPYTSGRDARITWKAIHKIFPLRRCSDKSFKNRTRPCLYHHMGQCPAPCVLEVGPAEYAETTAKVLLFLQGRSRELARTLKAEMLEASEALDFEKAAALRDQIRAIENTVEKQSVVLEHEADLDFIGLSEGEGGLALGLLFVRGGSLLGNRNYFWPGLTLDDAPELLASFLAQYYLQAETVPPRIVLPWNPEECAFVASDGADSPASLSIPGFAGNAADEAPGGLSDGLTDGLPDDSAGDLFGDLSGDVPGDVPGDLPGNLHDSLPANLADVASECASGGAFERVSECAAGCAVDAGGALMTNAAEGAEDSGGILEQGGLSALEALLSEENGSPVRIAVPRNDTEERLVNMASANAREHARQKSQQDMPAMLGKVFGVPGRIERIEAVDVSHTSGQATRVGMVVFEGGKPLREDWRNYAFEDGGGDDYTVLAAWAARRAESGPPWPDLLLIDGGRGQLAVVFRAFEEKGLTGAFLLASIAKARDDDGHSDRRAGNVSDRIFVPGRSNPLNLKPGAPELLFLQHVRNHVHDFAIGRHRKARSNQALAGELNRIPGFGQKLARELWARFNSLHEMASASDEALRAVPGMGEQRIRALREHLALIINE